MPFFLPSRCRTFFKNIFDSQNRDGSKLKLYFDEYYYCLMVGLASGKYDENAKLEKSEITDTYPEEYIGSRDYIAGLLVATERQRRGISEKNGRALEQLMSEYVDATSKTHLSMAGERRLNQYAARGIEIMYDVMSPPPVRLEDFLVMYLNAFQSGKFTEER